MEPRFPIEGSPRGEKMKENVEKQLKATYGTPPYPYISDDGKSLLGCYAALCWCPGKMGQEFLNLAQILFNPETIDGRLRELAICGLASTMKVPFIHRAHRFVVPSVGITAEQWDEGLTGEAPKGLDERGAMAYRLGKELATLNEPLDEARFQEATSVLTKEEFVGIGFTVASYRVVALLELVGAVPGQQQQ